MDTILSLWWIGILDGVLLAFLVYALILYFYNRQAEYLFYAGYVGLYCAYFWFEQIRFYSVLGHYFTSIQALHWIDTPLQLLTIICYVYFFRRFLNLSDTSPFLDRILACLIVYCWLCIGLDIGWKLSSLPVNTLSRWMVWARIPPTVLALYSLLVLLKSHRVEVMCILLGILSMVIGIVCTMLTALKVTSWADGPLLGGNPNTFLQLGIIGELLFFTFAISYRNKQVAQAKIKADIQMEKLREQDRLKDNLYTSISHDFRTPITVILGMAERINAYPEEQQLITLNSQKLLKLINQILDLSKLRNGQNVPNYQQSDLVLFVKYQIDAFQFYAQTRSISIDFQSSVEALFMDFDAEWLERILSNLLGNAVKFTPNGGSVSVRITPDEAKNRLILKVQDNGVGIDKMHLPHIFDWFYQVNTQLSREGSGIGLALAKELVESLNGRIWVESELEKGTAFFVDLPIVQQSKRITEIPALTNDLVSLSSLQDTTTNEDAASMPEATILIIEDNRDVARYLELSLTDVYQIQMASDGSVGWQTALEEIPDLVICDVMLPEQDGVSLCQKLKNDERTSHIPVILLTAKATEHDKLTGLAAGADAYLTKPFNQEELRIRIRNLIELRKKLQQQSLSAEQRNQMPAKEGVFLQKIDTILESVLENDGFQVTDLCREIGMSRTQLHRKITALTGNAITDYIRVYRLNRSRMLLETENVSVAEAAYRTGFKSASHYSRAFKQHFGYPPSQKQA